VKAKSKHCDAQSSDGNKKSGKRSTTHSNNLATVVYKDLSQPTSSRYNT